MRRPKLLLLPLLLGLPSCTPNLDPAAPIAPASAYLETEEPQEYQIALGDLLEIRFFYNEELTEEVQVRPDGRISLPLVQEVVAAGRTPAELTGLLRERYGRELEDPEVTVIVRTFNSHRAYVTGEVEAPGEVLLTGRLSALQAIALTGGFTEGAQRTQVLVLRRSPGKSRPVVVPLDLRRVQSGAGLRYDIELRPFDVVHVPKTRIAQVNQWIDQYVRQVLPFDVGFRLDDILIDE